MKSCGTCRFWLAQTPAHGLCRRLPPTPVYLPPQKGKRAEDVVAMFPTMMVDGWCGEHQPASADA